MTSNPVSDKGAGLMGESGPIGPDGVGCGGLAVAGVPGEVGVTAADVPLCAVRVEGLGVGLAGPVDGTPAGVGETSEVVLSGSVGRTPAVPVGTPAGSANVEENTDPPAAPAPPTVKGETGEPP
jgi:hypothetical protein